jgi:hypothetical protein
MCLPDYNFENENRNTRRWVGCYINSSLNYLRRMDLEGVGLHIVIRDVKTNTDLRIINTNRSFNPPNIKTLENSSNSSLK